MKSNELTGDKAIAQSLSSLENFFTLWDRLWNWITNTNNRIYIGWFGVLVLL